MSWQTDNGEKKFIKPSVDEEVDLILEVAENIKQKALEEAYGIVDNAKKKSTKINNDSDTNIEKKDEHGILKNGVKQKNRLQKELCPQKVFRIIFERERSRADRNGHELSFIVFDLGEETNEKLINILVKKLKSRARSVDKFGWYDEEHIGVILPNTSYKGGIELARDICSHILIHTLPPSFKIYSYPTMWLQKGLFSLKKNIKSKRKDHSKFIEGVNQIFIKKIPVWKRTIDIFGALIGIVILSPIFLFVAIIIKIVSPGPILFKQERVGQGGRIFIFLKFRTMKFNIGTDLHHKHSADFIHNEKPMEKLDKKDPRIIPFGRILRKTCIDEFPQLFNVIKGEMSLVGPRPCIPYEAAEYLRWNRHRFDIVPGITGIWQVSGKNKLTFKQMVRLDIMYEKKMNILLDLWILLKTGPAIIGMVIDTIKIRLFFNKMSKKEIKEEKFKEFIRRYYPGIYNLDKLEFLDDRLKNYHVDLMELMLLLSKLNKLSPGYNVAKRYFGILKLVEYEKKAQTHLE